MFIENLPFQDYAGLRQSRKQKQTPAQNIEQAIHLVLMVGLIIAKIVLIIYYTLN